RMARQAELNKGLKRISDQREIRPIWNNVQRVNRKNQFVPTAVLTRTGKILVNTAKASGTKIVSTARHSFNRQAVLTSTAMKVNTIKPILVLLRKKGKLSAGCNWRPQRYNWHNVSKYIVDPVLEISFKDNRKKKIEEEDESESESDGIPEAEKKFKQLASDEEMARKVQEEWEGKEERKILDEEEATNEALIINYDDIKERIEADRLLAEKLQEKEREQFTIEERAKFLHETIVAQRKFLAQQRSEAIRNRPPIRNQLRNQMMTYLKHV
ncbi:hypothetical protein Tco_0030399, partial [Tanacetum coccineum]